MVAITADVSVTLWTIILVEGHGEYFFVAACNCWTKALDRRGIEGSVKYIGCWRPSGHCSTDMHWRVTGGTSSIDAPCVGDHWTLAPVTVYQTRGQKTIWTSVVTSAAGDPRENRALRVTGGTHDEDRCPCIGDHWKLVPVTVLTS